jgi:hypothetical protein
MKTNARARTATTSKVEYLTRVQIIGSIAGETSDVKIGALRGNPWEHPVYSFATVNPGTIEAFRRFARASSKVKYYRSKQKPVLRSVADNYLHETLGEGWLTAKIVKSCYTPDGWEDPQPGHPCLSFLIIQVGAEQQPGILLARREVAHPRRNGAPQAGPVRHLMLRFFVSVHVDKIRT